MSNKNRTMTAKELKVKRMDAKALARNYGNECARDYDECGRTYYPDVARKPYAKPDYTGWYRVYFKDGRKLHYPDRLRAYCALKAYDGYAMRSPDGHVHAYKVEVRSADGAYCVVCDTLRDITEYAEQTGYIDVNNCTFMFM